MDLAALASRAPRTAQDRGDDLPEPGGPAIAFAATGEFVVVWEDLGASYPFDGQDGSGAGIIAQRFASDGSHQGSEFLVNTYTTGRQYRAAVAVTPIGDFLITWQSEFALDDDYESVQAQRFASSGNAVGTQFQVNTYTTSIQGKPSVAVFPNGDSLIGWSSLAGVRAQRYASDGSDLGGEFIVSSSADVNYGPSVAIADTTEFVFTYSHVLAQRFASDGTSQGGEFQVNTYTTGYQVRPAVAVDPSGNFAVVWESGTYGTGPDGDGRAVRGQRFLSSLIFFDGFESGDMAVWSSTSSGR